MFIHSTSTVPEIVFETTTRTIAPYYTPKLVLTCSLRLKLDDTYDDDVTVTSMVVTRDGDVIASLTNEGGATPVSKSENLKVTGEVYSDRAERG